MARGVVHLALRNPEVSGAALKLVAAWPLTELLRVDNTGRNRLYRPAFAGSLP